MRTQPMYEVLVGRIEETRELDGMAAGVDRASAALGDGTAYEALRGDWTGHALHPFLTDLPIGCWFAAGLLDAVGGRSGRRSAQRLVGWGLVFVPLTTVTGLADYRTMPDERTMRVGAVHAVGNTAAALVYFASWRRRRSGRHLSGGALGLVGAGLVAFTGFLGGHMSFARGTGVGERGSSADGAVRGVDRDADGLDQLIPVDEAAELLTVPLDQVYAMVEEGMLTPVVSADADGDQMRVSMSEVMAARHLGG